MHQEKPLKISDKTKQVINSLDTEVLNELAKIAPGIADLYSKINEDLRGWIEYAEGPPPVRSLDDVMKEELAKPREKWQPNLWYQAYPYNLNATLEDECCCHYYIKNGVSLGIRCNTELPQEMYNLLRKDLVSINVMGIPLHVSE